ncbi:hypothetical protein CMI39_03970 [Candidatus Pacearchaeota archaeon]|nr:hypothetical protein [Candidatus Pacearchaeota archaeon]
MLVNSCTGLETFAIGAAGNIAGDYIYNNVDLKEPGPVNVKIVKLTNGEELIGEYDDGKHIIKNPVVMIPLDEKRIGFNPWMPYAENKEYQLKEDQILVIADPSKHIANEYNKAFGSGIVVP